MEGGRERNDEPAVPTNGTEVDLPDKPRVLAFDPFFRPGPGPKRQIAAATSRFGFTTGQSRGSGSPSWVAGSYPSGKVRGTARQFIANVCLSLTGNHEQLDELALLYGR